MKQTTQIPIEHSVVTSDRSYDQVVEALETQLGRRADWEHLTQTLISIHATFEQAVQIVEQQLGTSGFTIFSKVEAGVLLTLSGNPTRATQYAIGNPLLAIQMIEHAPEVALYTPLRLAVYEDQAGKVDASTVVAYGIGQVLGNPPEGEQVANDFTTARACWGQRPQTLAYSFQVWMR